MRIDRKIADVCAVSLKEISFFDLFIVTFFRFSTIYLTSLRPRALVPASPISRPHASDIHQLENCAHVRSCLKIALCLQRRLFVRARLQIVIKETRGQIYIPPFGNKCSKNQPAWQARECQRGG